MHGWRDRLDVEWRLVCEAVRACPDVAALDVWSAASPNWDGIIRTLTQRGLLGVGARTLLAAGRSVPSGARAHLESGLFGQLARGLAVARQAAEVHRTLAGAGIPSLAYKGPVLGALAYGNAALRPVTDLDFLIAGADMDEAARALSHLGYALDMSGHRVRAASRRAAHQERFHPRDTSLVDVELHVTVTEWSLATRLRFADLFARRVPLDLCGRSVDAMSREDHLLVSAAHAAAHDWSYVRHASEIDHLVHQIADWDTVTRRARAARVERMLRVGLALAEALGSAIPPDIAPWARSDRTADGLARAAAGRWLAGAPPTRWQGIWRMTRYRERPADKLRYVVRNEINALLMKFPWERWRR